MAEQTTKTYIPRISYKGKELPFEDVPITTTSTNPYKCEHCNKPITIDQVEKTLHDTKCLSGSQIGFLNKILPYINKYRANYKLDTCLRKAHFIAQIGAEMSFDPKNMTEGGHYSYYRLTIGKFYTSNHLIDNTILTSLEKYLNEIFEIRDKDDKKLNKTNSQIKQIVKNANITYNVRELYGYRRDKNKKYLSEKNIKDIMETIKDSKGVDTEQIKYKIIIKKRTKAYPLETLSRAYSNKNKNGSELSREGYMYSGKGLKQITWKSNYDAFSIYRRDNSFEEGDKYIDFTKITDVTNHKGHFDKLADSNNVIYGVQSAIWYYIKGNPTQKTKKCTVDFADDDNIEWASRILNGGNRGKKDRRDNTFRARKEFKVYEHYKLAHKNGNASEKKKIEEQLGSISKTKKVSNTGTAKIDLKDPEAEKLFIELRKVESLPIKMIEFKIEAPNVDNIILKSMFSKKKKLKQ